MKNRRTVLISFILIACLCIGIGYAETTADLLINGSANTQAPNIDVYFSAASITSDTTLGGSTAGDLGTKSRALTLTARNLKDAGETVVATYTIKNESNYAVSVAVPTITLTNPVGGEDGVFTSANGLAKFKVETDWGNAAKVVNATDGTTTFTVTVTLLENLSSVNETGSFEVKFVATGINE